MTDDGVLDKIWQLPINMYYHEIMNLFLQETNSLGY